MYQRSGLRSFIFSQTTGKQAAVGKDSATQQCLHICFGFSSWSQGGHWVLLPSHLCPSKEGEARHTTSTVGFFCQEKKNPSQNPSQLQLQGRMTKLVSNWDWNNKIVVSLVRKKGRTDESKED